MFDPEDGVNATPHTYYTDSEDDASIATGVTEADRDDESVVVASGGARGLVMINGARLSGRAGLRGVNIRLVIRLQ